MMRRNLFIALAMTIMLGAVVSTAVRASDDDDSQRRGQQGRRGQRMQGQRGQQRMRGQRGGMNSEGRAERMNIVRTEEIGGGRLEDGTFNGPKVGTMAPDFELTPIKFYDFQVDAIGEINLENADQLYNKVKLSSFKDKKPVALIFGSYT